MTISGMEEKKQPRGRFPCVIRETTILDWQYATLPLRRDPPQQTMAITAGTGRAALTTRWV
jgi:hypothetical protein